MLKGASGEAIRERKEEVRGVTSSMLRILKEDMELAANSTRTTYQQLYWTWLGLSVIEEYRCKEAVAEGLVRKLDQLRDLTRENIGRAERDSSDD